MRGNATMQLFFLLLGETDSIRSVSSNAIPNIFDELNALGDRELHVFGGSGVAGHGRSVNQVWRKVDGCPHARIGTPRTTMLRMPSATEAVV